jgi:hypothetical protein
MNDGLKATAIAGIITFVAWNQGITTLIQQQIPRPGAAPLRKSEAIAPPLVALSQAMDRLGITAHVSKTILDYEPWQGFTGSSQLGYRS